MALLKKFPGFYVYGYGKLGFSMWRDPIGENCLWNSSEGSLEQSLETKCWV